MLGLKLTVLLFDLGWVVQTNIAHLLLLLTVFFSQETAQNPVKQEVQSEPQGLEKESESEGVQPQSQELEMQEEKELTESQATSDQKGK